MPINSFAGAIRSESVNLARRHAVAPAACRLLYGEPYRRILASLLPSGLPVVRGGVPSPVVPPAKQRAQCADPDSPACPTSQRRRTCMFSLRRHALLACRPLGVPGPDVPPYLDPIPAETKIGDHARYCLLHELPPS